MKKVDVAIIGGGLAGLYLAYLLNQQGVNFQLLEAKPDLGGRISSLPAFKGSALGLDLGPTWFWPHQRRIQQLLNDLDIPWFEQYVKGEALYQLEQNSSAQRVTGGMPMTSYRIRGGMKSLINVLQGALNAEDIGLSCLVTNLEQTDDEWKISFDHSGGESQDKKNQIEKVISAKQVVLAIPPRVLLKTLPIKNYLSSELCQTLANTPTWMAAQAKFVASYQTPFWREAGLSGDVFSRVGPLMEIHDSSAGADEGYALFGFVGIPANSRKQFPENAMMQLCLRQLVDIFGDQALSPEAMYFKDWSKDTYVVTDQDLNEPPVHPYLSLAPHKKELERNKLGFVGTEYASEEAGYLEGALASVEELATHLFRLEQPLGSLG